MLYDCCRCVRRLFLGDARVAAGVVNLPPKDRDVSNYTHLGKLRELIGSGDIALIKASYFLELCKSGGALPRRQELPAEAFVSPAKLEKIFAELEAIAASGTKWTPQCVDRDSNPRP